MIDALRMSSRMVLLRNLAWLLGLVCLVPVFVGMPRDPRDAFAAYLFSYWFWAELALGCFAIKLMHHLVGGTWGVSVRPLLVAAIRTLPLLAVLVVPLFFGIPALYPWANPHDLARDHVLRLEHAYYLNVPFLAGRTVLYFATWIALGWLSNRWTQIAEASDLTPIGRRMQALGALGLVVWAVTGSAFAIDWLVPLEARWHSTIFGMMMAMHEFAISFAFVIVVAMLLRGLPAVAEAFAPRISQDLGNLLLGFMLLWGYTEFVQYMIQYSGNLPDEVIWFVHRTSGSWFYLAWAWIGLHLVLPFALLLSRTVKRHLPVLAIAAGMLLLAAVVYTYWQVVPAIEPLGIALNWYDLALPGLGGLWVGTFLWQLTSPVQDGQLEALVVELGRRPEEVAG